MYKPKLALKRLAITFHYKVKPNPLIRLGFWLAVSLAIILFLGSNFQNLLNIGSTDVASDILSTITTASASVLAFIIAIILVAFEVLRKSYTIYAFRAFFKDKNMLELVVMYMATIIISLLTLSSLSNPLTSINIGMTHFSLSLFTISLIILLPYSRKIITTTHPLTKVKELVERIDASAWLGGKYEDNPVYSLSELGIRTMNDNDLFTPKSILTGIGEKLIAVIEYVSRQRTDNRVYDSTYFRHTIDNCVAVIRNIAYQAIMLKREDELRVCLEVVEQVYFACADRKLPLHELDNLDTLLQSVINRALDAKLDMIATRGLSAIERIMLRHLEINVPKESEIGSLHFGMENYDVDKYSIDIDMQWQRASRDFLLCISRIFYRAIELQDAQIMQGALDLIGDIGKSVLNLELGDLQKKDVIEMCNFFLREFVEKGLDSGLYQSARRTNLLCPFDSFYLDNILAQKKEYSKNTLMRCSEILIMLVENDSLDLYTLNQMGTIGRRCARNLEEHAVYKESLIFIIRLFKRIRSIVDKKLNNINKPIYLDLYKQLKSLNEFMKKKDKKVVRQIESAMSEFVHYEAIRAELASGPVKWPTRRKKRK